MTNSIFSNLNEIVEEWAYIKNYCYKKTLGNGFYDFSLTARNWQVKYAWHEVLSSFIEPGFNKKDLDARLEYYCECVCDITRRFYQAKMDAILMVDDLFFKDVVGISAKEVSYLNECYSKWFDDKFEIFAELPEIEIVGNTTVKRKQNRWNPMEKNTIDMVRSHYEAHRGQGEPNYILCVDTNDAKIYRERTKYIITFRDAVKTGITKISGNIKLSERASEVLYGRSR